MRCCVLWSLLFSLMLFSVANAQEFTVSGIPDWVTVLAYEEPENIPESEINDGVYYLLLDRQVKIDAQQPCLFKRIVKKVLNEQGVEQASQIYISFDPSFEKLVIHTIRVRHNNKVFNQLWPDKFTVFQRETELDRLLYNGEKTVSIILEATHPGDIIEYAYSIIGQNPVFQGKYMDYVNLAADAPINRLYYRWTLSADQSFFYKTQGNSSVPDIRREGATINYIIDKAGIAPVLSDSNLPDWFYPYSGIQISQFGSWQEVACWEAAFYQRPETISDALQQAVDDIKGKDSTPREIIAAALCAVQKQIRYLGIEIGTGSHKPTEPSLIFQRKFGDCKDKVYLLCTILDRLGINARPALVHTRTRRRVADYAPSSLVFNHVIARVQDDEGNTYWLDPTADCQQVPLDRQYQALYGKALVLAEETTGLCDTGEHALVEPEKEISERFDLTQGIGKPALLTIRTTYRGRSADAMRYDIKSAGLPQTAKSYLNYYASDYPSIVQSAPLMIEDAEQDNTFAVTEYYKIPDFWETSQEDGRISAEFNPSEFYQLVGKPKTLIRSMPLGISHPTHIVQQTTVLLPQAWSITPDHFQLENDAVAFDYRISYNNRLLTLSYSYRTKKDFIEAQQAKQYFADLDAIYNEIGYSIYSGGKDNKAEEDKVSGVSLAILFTGIVAAILITFWAFRYDPLPNNLYPAGELDGNFNGLGGWLVLVMIGLFISPIIILRDLAQWLPALHVSYWNNFNGIVRAGYIWPAKVWVCGTFVVETAILSLFLLLLVLFFKKRTAFPHLFIVVNIGFLLLVLADTTLAGFLFQAKEMVDVMESGRVGRSAVATIIWCIYMVKSCRVRQTFIKRRHSENPIEILPAL